MTLAALLALHPARAVSAELRVEVEGLRNDAGSLLVAACAEDAFLTAGCAYAARVPAGEGAATLLGVPPGTYAVQAFHDENDNLRIDRSFGVLPVEGMGFSRDAPMRGGPPRFRDAAFDLRAPGATVKLRMRYFQ